MGLSAYGNDAQIKHSEIQLNFLLSQSRMFLQRYFNSCLDAEDRCELNIKEYKILKNILDVIPAKFSDIKVIALWEHEAEGMFNLGVGAHRLAVIGF